MKKSLLIVLVCSLFATASFAQKAIGVRAGGSYGEISYQQAMGEANQLEADLGLGWGGGFALTGVYQWTFDIPSVDGFGWYAGLGARVLAGSNLFNVGVGGQIGIEMAIPNAPIKLSLDYRPMVSFIGGFGLGYGDAALGIRYCF